MADATNTPKSIDTLLDSDGAIDVGYEAAAPWLQAHCRPENETGREFAARELLHRRQDKIARLTAANGASSCNAPAETPSSLQRASRSTGAARSFIDA